MTITKQIKIYAPTKIEYDEMLEPAIYLEVASGREVNKCPCCNLKFKKDEKIVSCWSSSYRGKSSHTNRFHRKCFLKAIFHNFPELVTNEKLAKELAKEVVIDNL